MSPTVKDLKRVIILTAHYYGREISDEVLAMYAADLSEFNPAQVIQAYEAWRRSSRNKSFPLPSQIAEMLRPQMESEDEAKIAAARIFGAVSKFGWCNAQDARAFIGEVGWRVVEMNGGWQGLCESLKPSMIPSLSAQFRELAKSVIKEKQIMGSSSPQLERGPGLARIGRILNELVEGKK